MPPKPTRYLARPILVLLILTLCLSITLFFCAIPPPTPFIHLRQTTYLWGSLNTRQPQLVAATAVLIALYDMKAIKDARGLVANTQYSTPAKSLWKILDSTISSALLSLPAPFLLKTSGAYNTDAAQNWSCRLISLEREGSVAWVESGAPEGLGRIRRQSRLATHGPLVLLVAHLALLVLVVLAYFQAPPEEKSAPAPVAAAVGEDGDGGDDGVRVVAAEAGEDDK